MSDWVSAVVVFMLQGCHRQWPPSIGISPGSHPCAHPEGIGIIPDRSQREPAADGGRRYRTNSATLRFIPLHDLAREGYSVYSKLFGLDHDAGSTS